MKTKLWVWNWQGGGYNWCRALDREDALKQANAMTANNTLKVDEPTLREGTVEEIQGLDRQYASLFY